MTAPDPARRADDYDSGAGWNRVADAMDQHGAAKVLADPGLVEPAPLCGCCWGVAGRCGCDDGCGADHTRYRPTVDADVKGELL